MSLRKTVVPLLMMVVAIAAWLLRPERDFPDDPDSGSSPEIRRVEPLRSEPVVPAQSRPVRTVEPVEPPSVKQVGQEGEKEPSVSVEESTESILPLIPEWMLESGDVRRERVRVGGHWVERVRSRYAWPNGSLVEVEVSDLGPAAMYEQFKSLGFDYDLQAEAVNGTLRVVMDGEDLVSNLEYSEEDGSGQVQYIVAGRYLMEVQLENLPLESFQTLEDRDGLFRGLQRHAAETGE